MQRKIIRQTKIKQNRSKSKNINQSSVGRKNLILTNKIQSKNTIFDTNAKNGVNIKRSISPKTRNQIKSIQRKNLKINTVEKPEKRVKIQEYKAKESQNPVLQKQVDCESKISNIQIQCPIDDDIINDEGNLLSASTYPKIPQVRSENFLRDTHLANDLSKSTFTKKNQPIKRDKNILLTSDKVSLQKRKISNTIRPSKEKQREISQTKKRTLSKTKIGSKQKPQSVEARKKSLNKNQLRFTTNPNKIPAPKLIPKPKNQKTKQQQISKKKTIKIVDEELQLQATKTPSVEELQRLRQQNQKYKIFLASSAFKVEELRKQIEQHKQIRENQRNIYNFQLNNLRKQLECNKKQIGHLFSYDEPQTGKEIIPDQIIIETDNESSSVQESLQIIHHKSKLLSVDDVSQNNSQKLRKTNQNSSHNSISFPSSSNSNEKNLQGNEISNLIESIKIDLTKQEILNLKFLSQIEKIPSLQVKLSFQSEKESKSSQNGKQSEIIHESDKQNFNKKKNGYFSFENEDSSGGVLLLNSIGK